MHDLRRGGGKFTLLADQCACVVHTTEDRDGCMRAISVGPRLLSYRQRSQLHFDRPGRAWLVCPRHFRASFDEPCL